MVLFQKANTGSCVPPQKPKCVHQALRRVAVARGGPSHQAAADNSMAADRTATPLPMAREGLGIGSTYAPFTRGCLQPCCARRRDHQEPPANLGTALTRQITSSIRESQRLQDLEDIVDEWGSSFDYIHVSAAFAKAAKLSQNRPANAGVVAAKLGHIWKQHYQLSDVRGLANVLWAVGKLQLKDPDLWCMTVQTFVQAVDTSDMRSVSMVVYALASISLVNKGTVPGLPREHLQQCLTMLLEQAYIFAAHPAGGIASQDISNILWGCAKLRFSTGGHELAAFVQTLSRADIVEAANPQELANSLFALGELQGVCDLQSAISGRLWGRILQEAVLKKLSDSHPRYVTNTLLALARLATSDNPVISRSQAQHSATQLLKGRVAADVTAWNPQDLSNAMYACAKLQMEHKPLLDAFVVVAPAMVPTAVEGWLLTQVAWACTTLNVPVHAQFMGDVLSRSVQLLRLSNMRTPDSSVIGLAAIVSSSIARLDMQALAAGVVQLLSTPAVQQRLLKKLLPSHARMFWEVHWWLVSKSLLDGKGLSGCMTPEQLDTC
eukprot:GHUV01014614.1.p1 GENE.GHUV01014614.1~~GHUV01014614.1.p1  ORF type:complete len:551 (+),score=107.19 GHUV01014614.1:166-1818(+)